MVAIRDYVRAGSVGDIFEAYEKSPVPVRVIAGGTDLLAKLQPGAPDGVLVVDITCVAELNGISPLEGGLRIGAATKLADVENSAYLTGPWAVLRAGAGRVGSPQIRNLATLGGNICNASPAADTVPPLLVLDARAEILSKRGRREVTLAGFFLGPGRTALAADEILASVFIPEQPPEAVATYLKHSPRRAMDLSVVGVGVLLARSAGKLTARIALGAVAPTPLRAGEAEGALAEAGRVDDLTIAEAARLAALVAVPIGDLRASAEYRTAMVRALTSRALHQLSAKLS